MNSVLLSEQLFQPTAEVVAAGVERNHLAVLVDEDILDVANLCIGRIINGLLVPVGLRSRYFREQRSTASPRETGLLRPLW